MQQNLLPEEAALLEKSAAGDEQAFSELFFRYKNKLFAFLLRITNSRELAEDIVQDVFLKIWQHRECLPEVNKFDSYLFRTAKNHAINHLKYFSKRILEERNEFADTDPEKKLLIQNLENRIQFLIGNLPDRQKEIYRLRREQDLKIEEIAEYLGISTSTVKNHLTQALRNLREGIRVYYPDLLLSLSIIFFLL